MGGTERAAVSWLTAAGIWNFLAARGAVPAKHSSRGAQVQELLLKGEIWYAAQVADNPGERAAHCRVIDYKTGLTGVIRVS